MKLKFFNLLIILIIFISFTCIVNAEYLKPITIEEEEYFNIYDLLDIKNGIVEKKSDIILGDGKIFYINDNLFYLYENSIIYKINENFEPIEKITYYDNNYEINLPKTVMPNIDKNPFYLTKEQIKNYFELDIQSQGILYENIPKSDINIIPNGINFNFLKENILSLGYEYIGNDVYQYSENGEINNIIYFYENEIKIQVMHLTPNYNQYTLNLVLQSLYPNSYSKICSNLTTSEGVYDNRYFKSYIFDNYIELEIKDKFKKNK